MLPTLTIHAGNTDVRHTSHIERTCTMVIAALALVLGCTGEDEKPRPDFMSKPASTETPAAPVADDPKLPASPPAEVAIQQPSPSTDDTESALDHDRMPTFVIVGGPEADGDDYDSSTRADDSSNDDLEASDDIAATDEDEEDEEEEPREEDGTFYYGSTRPFIPPPLDAGDPPPGNNVDVSAPPAPSAIQLAPIAAPWKPTSMSELEKILDREERTPTGEPVYPTDEEIAAMDRLGEIPTPPDPNPSEAP